MKVERQHVPISFCRAVVVRCPHCGSLLLWLQRRQCSPFVAMALWMPTKNATAELAMQWIAVTRTVVS